MGLTDPAVLPVNPQKLRHENPLDLHALVTGVLDSDVAKTKLWNLLLVNPTLLNSAPRRFTSSNLAPLRFTLWMTEPERFALSAR